MPEPTVVKTGEDKPTEPVSSVLASEAASSGAVQTSESATATTTVVVPKETYRTAELLQHWPSVLLTLQKAREAYSSVKQSTRIIGWSLDLTEKAVGSVLNFAEAKMSSLRPALQYADKAVSEGVVAIEKKFPVVRESPEKLYDAITQRITKIVRPAFDKTTSISEIGRKKLNRISKKIVKTYGRFMRSVDRWLDTLETRLNGQAAPVPGEAKSEYSLESTFNQVLNPLLKGAEGSAAEPESVSAVVETPTAGRARQAARLGLRALEAVSAFQVGAACWLLANTPIVGRLFAEDGRPQPSLTSSSSSSSSDVSSSSSSSSRLTPPAAAEESLSRPLSVHSLHPEPFLPEPPQTTA